MVRKLNSPAQTAVQPVRTCIGCKERAARSELMRIVAGTDSEGRPAVVPDLARTAAGRGAHLHPTLACYELAVRRRAFARALKLGQGLDSAPVGDWLAQQQ
ncbi:YlxR family protein [Nocardioides cavernaquae]|nr:YlxR family protein [Nocardioides cavernaquae]